MSLSNWNTNQFLLLEQGIIMNNKKYSETEQDFTSSNGKTGTFNDFLLMKFLCKLIRVSIFRSFTSFYSIDVEEGLEEKVAAAHLEDLIFKLLGVSCSFTVVPNCFLAIESCEHTDFDAILICGHSLKHIQAFDFLRIFRSVGGLAPVIIMSEYYDEIEIEDYLVEGNAKLSYDYNDPPRFNGKLHKPFTKKEICSLVANVYQYLQAKRLNHKFDVPLKQLPSKTFTQVRGKHVTPANLEGDQSHSSNEPFQRSRGIDQNSFIGNPFFERRIPSFPNQPPIQLPEQNANNPSDDSSFLIPVNDSGIFMPHGLTYAPYHTLGRDLMRISSNTTTAGGDIAQSLEYISTIASIESEETKTSIRDGEEAQQTKRFKKHHM